MHFSITFGTLFTEQKWKRRDALCFVLKTILRKIM